MKYYHLIFKHLSYEYQVLKLRKRRKYSIPFFATTEFVAALVAFVPLSLLQLYV